MNSRLATILTQTLRITAFSALAMTTAYDAAAEEDLSAAPAAGTRTIRGAYPVLRYSPMPRNESPIPDASCHLTYYGGPVISSAHVVVVYWGSGVNSGWQSYAPGFFQAVVKSTYMDFLQEYNTQTQKICRGTYVSAVTITPSGGGSQVDDANIGPELASQIQAGKLPAPVYDAGGHTNTIYMIYFPPGVTITGPGGAGTSCVQFCGYHSNGVYNNKILPYAVIPDLGGQCAGGCGQGSMNANLGSVSSHELIEAITDVDIGDVTGNSIGAPAAWYDDGTQPCAGEIGDICNGQQATVGSYTVQREWSNKQGACVVSGSGYTPCGACTTNADCSAPTSVCNTATGDCVQCTSNAQCSGATPTCNTSNGTCRACGADSDCSSGQHCDTSNDANKGHCVQCTSNAQCSNPTPVCTNNACGGCKSDADCAGNAAGSTCNTSTGACGSASSSGGGSGSGSGSGSGGSGSGSGGSGSGSGGSGSGGDADGGVDNGSGDQFSSTSNTGGCSLASGSSASPFAFGAFAALGLAAALRGRRKSK